MALQDTAESSERATRQHGDSAEATLVVGDASPLEEEKLDEGADGDEKVTAASAGAWTDHPSRSNPQTGYFNLVGDLQRPPPDACSYYCDFLLLLVREDSLSLCLLILSVVVLGYYAAAISHLRSTGADSVVVFLAFVVLFGQFASALTTSICSYKRNWVGLLCACLPLNGLICLCNLALIAFYWESGSMQIIQTATGAALLLTLLLFLSILLRYRTIRADEEAPEVTCQKCLLVTVFVGLPALGWTLAMYFLENRLTA